MRVRRPYLRSIEDIILAIGHRAQLQRGKVRSRAGLRKALAPIILARQDARQIMGALLGAAIVHDHRRNHLEPHGGEVGCPGPRALGGEDITLDRSEEHTSELQSLMRTSYAV